VKASYPTPAAENFPQLAGFSFDMRSDSGVTGAVLTDHAHQMRGGGGSQSGPFNAGFSYAGDMPAGPLTVNIESFSANLAGHWQVEWQTPATAAGQVTPAPQLPACLTRKSWQQALNLGEGLPAGLIGKLASSDVPPPDYHYRVSLVNLDGSDQKQIGLGDSPSFSPDGKRIVYNGPMQDGPSNGLYITDIASGATNRMPGTARGDSNPLWSADGTRIAFTRGPASGLIGAPGPYNLMVSGPDGSNLRALTSGIDSNFAKVWLPDGKRLLFTHLEQDGVSIRTIDVDTGEIIALFEINYNGSLVVSPDGKHLAFEEMLPLDKYGLFVSDLDGSNRKLLADGDPYIVTVPMWSPDGQWLIASVHDPDTNKQPNSILALIQVGSCRIIPLPDLSGYISGWLPE
jgi:hypothetical protein